MMDITAILHMHAELSLTAVFILMFLLDLFLPATQRHWLRPMACILLTIQLLANLWPEEVTLFGGMYHSTPMASVLKSILTIGTILVFLQADTWLNVKTPVINKANSTSLPSVPCWVCISW